MASSSIPSLQFNSIRTSKPPKTIFPIRKLPSNFHPSPKPISMTPSAKFNLYEMMGGRGLFNGENGLQMFIEKNTSPLKKSGGGKEASLLQSSRPKSPELPLLMPGMVVIVKNAANPFHMYSGIVQRVTDGKAGVLFEGGNWDKLLTFKLHELERREKGPPMINPKSAIHESFVDTNSV
uniref:Chlororespiratory reduction31 n=1 Tax=Masdevallia picturata TaxID=125444 RepID=A0A0F7CYV4_9ASPA